MPVYEYECDVCGTRFDVHRHFGDPPPTTCPHGHNRIHRLFAPPAIIFKGSGFYITDHGRNGRVQRRQSEDRGSSASEKDASKEAAKEGGEE